MNKEILFNIDRKLYSELQILWNPWPMPHTWRLMKRLAVSENKTD